MILQQIIENIKLYPEFIEKKLWRYLTEELHCPKSCSGEKCDIECGGTRRRKPRGLVEKAVVIIQRFLCNTHRCTFSFIPPFLLPRLHYPAATVNGFVEGYLMGEDVPSLVRESEHPEERTVRRWINRLTSMGKAIKKWASNTLAKEFYTFDMPLLRALQEPFQHSARSPLLKRAWALLKCLAVRKAEDRVPYHYLISALLGWVKPQPKPGST